MAFIRSTVGFAAGLVFLLSACAGTEAGTDGSSARLCTSGALSSDVPSYQATPGALVTWSGAASCAFVNPEYEFWLQPPGGGWGIVQPYGTATTYLWDTTALAPGTYNWQVWVREAGSTAYTETYGAHPFILTGGSACATVTTAASPVGSATVGTPVTLTSSASCGGGTAEYEVWHLAPGGSWALVQPYSTTADYAWDTTAEPSGRHSFQVWARVQGSAQAYEAYSYVSYLLNASDACTQASVLAAPASPSVRGTSVTFSASSSGCGSPTYQFWMLPPGGSWSIAQAYSASSTFVWDTTAMSSGDYSFQVWARAAGSTSSYESYAAFQYTVTFTPTTPGSPVGSGLYHSCAVRSDGTVNCWGTGIHGELGDGAGALDSATPVVVSGLSGVTSIAAGYYHTCAIVAGGAVSCWGWNSNGQLGDGTINNGLTPVSVSGLTGATMLAGGAGHTCAVLTDGTVRCWGSNTQGQIGTGAISGVLATPQPVVGVSGVVAVSAGYYHTCALLATGRVVCWGNDYWGQLGDGTTTDSLTPVSVTGLTDVRSISTAGSSNCAVMFDSTVQCWGYNLDGQLADGTTTSTSSPVVASGLANVASVSEGHRHGCATLSDGTAKCWGYNFYGELGDGTTTTSGTPVVVAGLSGLGTIAVGGYHSCALLSDATARCWGYGEYGALGNGIAANSSTPVVVSLP